MKNANHLNVALTAALLALTGSIAIADVTSSGAERYARRPGLDILPPVGNQEAPPVGEINEGATHEAPEFSDHDAGRDEKPPVAAKAGDINGDGRVNVDDFLLLMQDWGTCNGGEKLLGDIAPQGGNCAVDVDDLLIVLDNWES